MSQIPVLEARRTAVVVVDVQNDFCAEGGFLNARKGYDVGFAAGVASRIAKLVESARQAGAAVVWVRSHYDFKYLNPAEIAKRGEEGCCMEDSWGAQFFMLTPGPGEPVITKHHFGGFHDTTLDDELQTLGVETLVMTGVATNVCVDSTLREGFFRGYRIVLVEDCVDSNNAAGHAGTLATVRANIGIVATADEVADMLQAV